MFYFSPRSEFYGQSTSRPNSNGVIIDLYCIKYAKQFFKQGGHMDKYVSVQQVLKDAEFNRMAQQIQTNNAGLEHAHKMQLFDGGAKIETIGSDPKRVALETQRQLALDESCMVYGVPPIMLMLPNSTHYNNAEAQERQFYKATVVPKNRNWTAAVNRSILNPIGYECEVDYSQIPALQEDIEAKARSGKTFVDGRLMRPNEVRTKLLNMEPYDGGDEFPANPTGGEEAPSMPAIKSAEHPVTMPMLLKLMEMIVDMKIQKREHIHVRQIEQAKDKPIKKAKGKYPVEFKKALEAHAKKIQDAIYPEVEKHCIKGYKRFMDAALGSIGEIKKALVIRKDDIVTRTLSAMDDETKGMMADLVNAEKSSRDKIIKAEMERTKKKLSDDQIKKLNDELDKRYEKLAEDASTNISATAKERVRGILEKGLSDDKSTGELTSMVKDLFEGAGTDKDSWPWARTIARTEALKYANTTRFAEMNAMGFQKKQWFHSGHADSRDGGKDGLGPNHLDLDGVIVGMDEPFIDPGNGHELMFPGDPGAEPEDVICCGCTCSEAVEQVLTDDEIAALELENADEND
jgi:hypothetical protein